MSTVPGVDVLITDGVKKFKGARVGVVCHQASISSSLIHTADIFHGLSDLKLVALFGPQHGIFGEKQDDMIESRSFVDQRLLLPVHSLYGEVRKPTNEMLDGLDVLFFDLQDVGVRVYTFVWTMILAMQACREAGVACVVLDRPNPVGGCLREGTLLKTGFESFVGMYPLPLRHGITAGELARLANDKYGIGCDLDVIPCRNWRRDMTFNETALPWVQPSPNLPTPDSCVVYPGMVLLEGTNLSEGRGTTRPFELFGAPFLNPFALCQGLAAFDLPGVTFRPCYFEPTFQKHMGKVCGGAQLHVSDIDLFRPVETAVSILAMARNLSPNEFAWREPPYEYETERMPIDIIWGSTSLRDGVDAGRPASEIVGDGIPEIVEFERAAKPYLLY